MNTIVYPIYATTCPPDNPIYGAVKVTGYVYAVATNGAGLTTLSQRFAFAYKDIGNAS